MASLRVKDQGAGPMVYGRWRDGARNVERPIGRGWLVRVGEGDAKPNGRTIGAWRERSGKARDGALTVQEAEQALPGVVEAWRAERAQEEALRAREQGEGLTVGELGLRFLRWGEQGDPHEDRDPWKHSHLQNMRAYVRRITRELGEDRSAESVTEAELRRFLRGLTPKRNGKPTGDKPTRKFLANYAVPLKSMFALAARSGWIEHDPAVDLPTYKPKRKRAADPLRREEYLTPEEVRAVLAQLGGSRTARWF